MRTLVAALVLSSVAATGCMVRVPGVHAQSSPVVASEKSEKSEKKCPPGHMWSDGQCHSKGKGHDKHQ